jgi:hypothetical protein
MAEFARLEDELLLSSSRKDNLSKVKQVWTNVAVKSAELGWREKGQTLASQSILCQTLFNQSRELPLH